MATSASIIKHTQQWLTQVVIGLNLCPFAAKPHKNNQVRIKVSQAENLDALLHVIQDELNVLINTSIEDVDTTLIIEPNLLNDFYEYNDFLDNADRLLNDMNLEGIFQIASFHPQYCFAGVPSHAKENLTNRAPYPLFHIIREESMNKAVDHHPDVDAIPERNIKLMNSLNADEIEKLFPYLAR